MNFRRFGVILLSAAGAVLFAAPAVADPPGTAKISAEWMGLTDGASKRTVVLIEGKSQPYVQIVPKTAFRLEQDALDARGKPLVPQGTVFTAIRERSDVRCEVKRRKKQRQFLCLLDQNGDGSFESAMRMFINSELFISGGFARIAGEPLRSPTTLTSIDSRTDAERYTIEIFFYNRAEIVKRNDVEICIIRGDIKSIWGSAADMRICLPNEISVGDADYPRSVSLYGGSFVLRSREENRIIVEIDPPNKDFIL